MTWFALKLNRMALVGLLAACGGDEEGDDGGDVAMSSSGPTGSATSAPSTTPGTGGTGAAGSDDQGDGPTAVPPATSTSGSELTGMGAEGPSGPCFDGEKCLSILEILLPDDRDTFSIYLNIDPDSGTVTCPEGTTTDWLMNEWVTPECSAGSVTIYVSGTKFKETVTVGLDDAEPQEHTPGFEDDLGGCISQCNQATLQL